MRRASPYAFLLLLGVYLAGLVGAPWFHEAEIVPLAHAEGSDHQPGILPSHDGEDALHDGRDCAACAWDLLHRGCPPPSAPLERPALFVGRRAPLAEPWLAVATPRLRSARAPPRG